MLSEFVWNALDADATEAGVELEYDDLGGLSKSISATMAAGMPRADVSTRFGNLGGSWKRRSRHTKNRRRPY